MKNFLFIQGPTSSFFRLTAEALRQAGHKVFRINLTLGDWLFWRTSGATTFRRPIAEWPEFLAKYLDDNQITDIIVLGEQREYHKIAAKLAAERGIRVIATDFGYVRPDWITLEYDGLGPMSRFPRDPEAIYALAERCPPFPKKRLYNDSFSAMAVRDVIYHLTNYFFRWWAWHYHDYQQDNPVLTYLGTGLRLINKKRNAKRVEQVMAKLKADQSQYFIFAMQMERDFSIRAYSPFDDMPGPIAQVVESFATHAAPKDHLLIKLHPLDPGLRNWQKIISAIAKQHNAADRVHFLDGGNLDLMTTHARGFITVNSTAGLQAVSLGTPVKLMGNAVYDVKGMVSDQDWPEFWANPAKPDRKLTKAFLRALVATVQIRGVFYANPGLQQAAEMAAYRLGNGLINEILPFPGQGADAPAQKQLETA